MIIWGSKGREINEGEGYFLCPRCGVRRKYIHKRIGKYFTLYFIPLFQTKKLAEYIECQFCFTPYEIGILEMQNKLSELSTDIREQLEQGTPVNFLIQNLKENNIPEDVCKYLIFAATNGKMKICNNCNLFYTSTLNFCPLCSNTLTDYSGK